MPICSDYYATVILVRYPGENPFVKRSVFPASGNNATFTYMQTVSRIYRTRAPTEIRTLLSSRNGSDHAGLRGEHPEWRRRTKLTQIGYETRNANAMLTNLPAMA